MAKAEGEIPDFDEVDLSGTEPAAAEPLDEPTGSDDELAHTDEEEDGEETAETAEEEAEEESEKKGGLLTALANASPYTVVLGLSLLAILVAILCLLLEWRSYDFEVKAKDKPVSAISADQLGPASTAAAAWPIGVQLTSRAGAPEDESGSSRIT